MDVQSRTIEIKIRYDNIRSDNISKYTDLRLFLDGYKNVLLEQLEKILISHSYLKFNLAVSFDEKLVKTENYLLAYTKQITSKLDYAFQNLCVRIKDEWNCQPYDIHHIECTIFKLFNSPYGGKISPNDNSVPPFLRFKNTRCLLSVSLSKLHANLCFEYAVAAAIKKVPFNKNPNRPSHYHDVIKRFVKDSYCPSMPVHMYSLFESSNEINLNVYKIDCNKKGLVKLYLSNNKCYKTTVNLLLYNKHYYTIRSMPNLLKMIKTKFSIPSTEYTNKFFNKRKLFTCNKCLQTLTSLKAFNNHSRICLKYDTRYGMPKKGSCIEFSSYRSLFTLPFVYYWDTESFISNYDRILSENIIQQGRHIPFSIGVLRICADNDNFSKKIKVLHGDDVISQFLDYLEKEQKEVETILKETNFPINFSNSQLEIFQKAISCHCCHKLFSSTVKKVADHNHLIEKHNFRFALCDKCNLTYGANRDYNLTLFCHNLNYDIKFILEKLDGEKKVEILARNTQNFLSVKIGQFLFLDTMNFLDGSLARNVENVRKDSMNNFFQTKKICPDMNKLNLLLKKQVYPYDYAKKLTDYYIPSLPPIDKFFNTLTQEHISKEDYEHAENIYRIFNCKTFLDYTLVYLMTDVYLLCDCFELFRKNTMIDSGLDAAKFVTKHSLNFQEYLLYSGEKIPLITDRKMLQFIQKGIRGGFSVINTKLSLANNEFCGELYDSSKPKSYMLYLDANNLYSKALSYKLAFSDYEWLSQEEMNKIDFETLSPEDDIGYIVEVDLSYPDKIHDETADFPFCLEKMNIKEEMLSSYSQNLKNKLGVKHSVGQKLVGTLYDKKNYIIHSRLLSFFLNNGMKLTKIHRGVKFYQKEWLKDYMDKNTKMRQKADSKITRDFYKLKNNSIYGKLLQSDKGKIRVKVVSNIQGFDKQIALPNFKSYIQINENITLVVLEKKTKLTRPLPAAVCCLDLSKLVMYQFHKITRTYLPNSKILFSDTDSFLLYVETENVYKDLKSFTQYLDTSNYHPDHELYSNSDKLKPGLFKDEFPINNLTNPELPIIFVGLKPKMYMLFTNYNQHYVKSKGVGGNKAKTYKLSDFVNCLLKGECQKDRIVSIRSRDAQIFTEQSIKITLNPFDDKRYFINAIFSIPYGYFGL